MKSIPLAVWESPGQREGTIGVSVECDKTFDSPWRPYVYIHTLYGQSKQRYAKWLPETWMCKQIGEWKDEQTYSIPMFQPPNPNLLIPGNSAKPCSPSSCRSHFQLGPGNRPSVVARAWHTECVAPVVEPCLRCWTLGCSVGQVEWRWCWGEMKPAEEENSRWTRSRMWIDWNILFNIFSMWLGNNQFNLESNKNLTRHKVTKHACSLKCWYQVLLIPTFIPTPGYTHVCTIHFGRNERGQHCTHRMRRHGICFCFSLAYCYFLALLVVFSFA